VSLELYAAFVAATAALMLIPGPNVALIVANSVAHGARHGLLTVAGTTSAAIPQLLVAALGMTALLSTLGQWFEALRWAGVAYLGWLGVQHWRAPAADLAQAQPAPPLTRVFGRGVVVSLANPKTLLFYGAFFPQFVSAEGDVAAQLVLLCSTYLAVAALIDSGWALAAARARRLLARRGRWRNRLTAGLLFGAGAGLALARQGR